MGPHDLVNRLFRDDRRLFPSRTKSIFLDRCVIMKDRFDGRSAVAVALCLLGSGLLWALWPALTTMADRWASDPRYAHGYFVPLFALALLWMRRARLGEGSPRPVAWGLVPVAMGAALQLVGGYYRIEWFEGLALLPYLVGLAMLLGGRRILAWAWPSIAFLAFMVPLPWRIETALGPPLQYLATEASTYVLQTLGFMAIAEGNVIQLNEATIGVVEACNGLSMLMTFIALSTAAALVVRRPLVDRVVLVASSVPVALLANIARITMTGVLHETVSGHASSTFYHDLAGWVMMPMALALYWIEIAVLSRLLIEDRHEGPRVIEMVDVHRPSAAIPVAGKNYEPSIP
jgi:exosortase